MKRSGEGPVRAAPMGWERRELPWQGGTGMSRSGVSFPGNAVGGAVQAALAVR